MKLMLIFGVLCIAGVAGASDNPQEKYAASVKAGTGLLADWRFEGNADDATGTLKAAAKGDVEYVDGVAGGKAASFAKGGCITVADASKLDIDSLTVEFFFRVNSAIAQEYNPCLISKRRSLGETRFSIHVFKDLSNIAIWNGGTVTLIEPADGPIQLGRWYHVVLSTAPTKTVMYIDGIECLQMAGGIMNPGAKGMPLQIGASSPKGDEVFHGDMAEVAIFDRGLTPDEVAAQLDALGWGERHEKLLVAQKERKAAKLKAEQERREQNAQRVTARIEEVRKGFPAQVYEGKNLDAISFPVGGIGAGQIHFNGKAEPYAWQIFNNFEMAKVPHSFFAVYVKVEGEEPIVRVLQTTPVGPFLPMESLAFNASYPHGEFIFKDARVPVTISMRIGNPFIPMNAKDSASPCAIVELVAERLPETTKQVEMRFLAVQQNAVGFTGQGIINERRFIGYGKNTNKVVREKGLVAVHLIADREASANTFGDMALATFDEKAVASASFESLEKLAADFASAQGLAASDSAGPSPDGETLDAALCIASKASTNKNPQARFLIAWHFPNAKHGQAVKGWEHTGNMYANWWPDALAVARDVCKRYDKIKADTAAFEKALYQTPEWLTHRIGSQLAIMRSPTLWWAKDGYIGGWEGCGSANGCCNGNCAHVWHYAQAHARLFPEIARRMREQVYAALLPDGGVPFRQGGNEIACDAQTGEVLESYREYLTSADEKWLDANWPSIKKMMEYAIATWDKDEDGVLAGTQHNTLDCNLGGSTSWLGSMYLAALKAVARMAEIEKDADTAARCARIFESGAKKQNETLFNGEYYIQIPDPAPQHDYNNGCHIDQALGQWWANQLDLGTIYPQDRVQSAMRALLKYNFRDSLKGVLQAPRKFVDDNDAGMQMIQWPNMDRPSPHTLYADEVMSGFEYSAAATMIQEGMPDEGLMVVKAAADRYDGRLRTGLTPGDFASWGYSGNPFGDDECGKYYARAMSIWSVLLACQGFVYDGPAGRIGFKPVTDAARNSFFSTAEGWGVFNQEPFAEGKQLTRLNLKYGTLAIKSIVLQLPAGLQPDALTAEVALEGGKPLKASLAGSADKSEVVVKIDPLTLKAGETLSAKLTAKAGK